MKFCNSRIANDHSVWMRKLNCSYTICILNKYYAYQLTKASIPVIKPVINRLSLLPWYKVLHKLTGNLLEDTHIDNDICSEWLNIILTVFLFDYVSSRIAHVYLNRYLFCPLFCKWMTPPNLSKWWPYSLHVGSVWSQAAVWASHNSVADPSRVYPVTQLKVAAVTVPLVAVDTEPLAGSTRLEQLTETHVNNILLV